MMKQILRAIVLGSAALLLASCVAKNEPTDAAAPSKGITLETPKETPPAKADPREIKLHVDGMTDRLNLV